VYVRKGSAAVAVCAEWGVTCGVGNVLANKGALGLVLRVGGANVGVLTAHLAAHQGKVQARNDDFHRIMASSAEHLRGVDGVLFGGDLNYRLDLTKEEVELSLETDHADLLGCDQVRRRCGHLACNRVDARLNRAPVCFLRAAAPAQLTKARFSGAAFSEFSEGGIRFAPTFKFDKNENVYDTSKKRRVPAWTDRILYKGSVELTKYGSIPNAMTSDHRPVYATFRLSLSG
jgi:endonuclease/exonuclease/phosphatase family metal-dependent hydrolase